MSVKSDVFGSVRLTGKDAAKFKRQIDNGRPKRDAIDSAKRGRVLAQEYAEKGYASIGQVVKLKQS